MCKKRIHISITVVISIAFVLLGIFVFGSSYLRFWEALKDVGRSAVHYFCWIFEIDTKIQPTVNNYSKVLDFGTFLPTDFEAFKGVAGDYFSLLCSKDNLFRFGEYLGQKAKIFAKILTILLPLLVILFLIIKRVYEKENNNYDKDTKPLKVFKWLCGHIYEPVRNAVLDYVHFLQGISPILKVWVVLWLFNLNIASIAAGFLAYYLYFAVSLEPKTLFVQAVKLIVDLQVILKFLPVWCYPIIAYVILDVIRKAIGNRRLRHFEARNCGFIKELPIVSMTCGSMGKKKTTIITDMALSQEKMFRQKALDILTSCDMRYPKFPWICFEQEIKACMEHHTIYNLSTVKKWVRKKKSRFAKHHNADLQLYSYNWEKYGSSFDNSLSVTNLFDTLETYAQAYFVYVVSSSLIVSNYSIRTSEELMDHGNFPMWYNEFFPKFTEKESKFSHILDFDTLRLGKKLIENNPNTGSFEFGVVVISEVGKERGNNLELKEVKKGTDEANQKNDLFNAWLKMCRHSATVDNFPFVKVFTDEQRPESWGADARDLCDILHIISSGELRLAMPFYTIEDMVSEWVFNKVIKLYYDFRFRRGDNTLLIRMLKNVSAWVWKRNLRIYNRYGFSVLKIAKERGTMDGKLEKKKYYLMNKKIYSRRFSTDCFSDYFNDLADKANVGIGDYLEYATGKASVEELKLQNSYFINSLYR